MSHSQATKEKIRKALTGNKNAKGFIPSAETREKLSKMKTGSNNPNYGKPAHNKGKPMSEAQKKKLSQSKKGKPAWNKGIKGTGGNNKTSFKKGQIPWNFGMRKPAHLCSSSINARIRAGKEYKLWRQAVLIRDGHACIWCGSKSNLHADHIKPFAYFPELRFAIDNGRTLCKECHKTTDTYLKRQKSV